MATHQQIQANRGNTQLSAGPRIEQGKAISRGGAPRPGIDARNEAASGEDPAALAADYDHQFQPIGVVERLLAAGLVNHSSGVAYEAKRGAGFDAGFAANTNSFQRLYRHIIDAERSRFTHLGDPERRQALRRPHQADVDSSVTDSPETENPGIGFVSQPTPNPAGPASSVTQHAARHDPATAPGVLSPNAKPQIGFVPHTTPSVPPHNRGSPPICARPAERLLAESHGYR